jgi:uncharacterized protein
MLALLVLIAALLLPHGAFALDFPKLTGRVTDAANVIPDDEEARLTQKLEALEQKTGRQMVIATVPSLQDNDINDYANQLYRAWQIGDKQRNDGVLLLIAPNERKVRIEVGYGLEGTITDGISFLVINQQILPRFKAGDMPGGIEAGADALIQQLGLPADQAQQVAANANAQRAQAQRRGGGFPIGALLPLAFIFLFVILPMMRRRGGRSGFGSGLGSVVLWDALNSGGRGGGWGGGGDWGGGGGGGFSGGGGSSGGGGASGGW